MASSLMEIGKSALFASQAAIQTTGNNIANVNTPGYTRQYVRLDEQVGLNYRPGRMGQGVNAVEVLRYFDTFLEKSYVDKHSTYSRWDKDSTLMSSVENIFNEANRTGVSSQMSAFFSAWQDLSLRPQDMATRESLLSQADSLAGLIRSTEQSVRAIQDDMDTSISVDVDRANELIRSIYDLSVQIKANTEKGVSNPNDLLDKRDQLTRELSEIIDVSISDRDGEYYVRTQSGLPLVDDVSGYFSLAVQGPKAEAHLAQLEGDPAQLSQYTGKVNFSGSDAYEYTLEMVRGGDAGGTPPPQFRVSLDGGKTWLKNDDGSDLLYEIPPNDPRTPNETMAIQVKNLQISFEDQANSNTSFNAGDRFVITPKSGVYFVAPTKGSTEGLPKNGAYPYTGPINITPQTYFDGTENGLRITGGSLAAYFNIRDNICGSYLDKLDAVTNSMIWEVNRLHSQGAGLEDLSFLSAENSVAATNIPLGAAYSGLDFYDRLTAGNLTFHLFDSTTGDYVGGGNPLVFPPDANGSTNFDPTRHTLQDVADALNNYTVTDTLGNTVIDPNDPLGGPLTPFKAEIISGKLQITITNPGYSFTTGSDSTGLLAALGLNTFFSGSEAGDIAVNADLRNDPTRVAAGKVDGAFEANVGDNDTAKAIAALMTQKVSISTMWQKTTNQSLNEYYNSFVAKVGADTRASQNNALYSKALNDDLETRQSAVSGVSLDEEMANLIKFQHSYTAAAKLITTADQMMQTVLGLKQ
ncbi:MAG: flagellar hook-associated protein FlgK [Betaproteobacteria bacterium]|nr:flagellar hook-associated protein FlgK [Betaproteobacteria bacterium]